MNESPSPTTISASLATIARASPSALQHFTLDNGLSVYLREDHSAPLAAVQLWYHIGSSHEPAGHSNLSHLLEHLMFKGSSKLPGGHYSRLIARLGGKANAATHDDSTAFDVLLPVARLPIALEIMADAMHSATLGQTDFEREIKVIEDERRLKIDSSPTQQAFDQHRILAQGDSVYAQPAFGHARDLAEMQLASVRTWYRTWYRPNNATLVVVGAIDQQRLGQWVDEHFAALPAAPLGDKLSPVQPGEPQERSLDLVHPGLRAGLFMSFNTPSLASTASMEAVHALRLLCEVLGKGFSSRLYSELVRDKRAIKGIDVSYQYLLRGDSLLTLSAYANTDVATPEQAAQAIWAIIDELRRTPLPEALLERAKLRLLTRQLYARENIAQQAALIGQAAAAGIDPVLLDQAPAVILDLTSATVQKVANQYLRRERLTTTYLQQGAAS
ncbi:M16 family metallopeptidase [Pseudomonas putida]